VIGSSLALARALIICRMGHEMSTLIWYPCPTFIHPSNPILDRTKWDGIRDQSPFHVRCWDEANVLAFWHRRARQSIQTHAPQTWIPWPVVVEMNSAKTAKTVIFVDHWGILHVAHGHHARFTNQCSSNHADQQCSHTKSPTTPHSVLGSHCTTTSRCKRPTFGQFLGLVCRQMPGIRRALWHKQFGLFDSIGH
jgi:hypothetical protein